MVTACPLQAVTVYWLLINNFIGYDTMSFRKVVITGISTITSLGLSADETWHAMLGKKQGINELIQFVPEGCRTNFGGEILDFPPKNTFSDEELKNLDRASMMVLFCANQLFEDSLLSEGSECDVILGTTLGGMLSGEKYYSALTEGQKRPVSLLHDFLCHKQASHIARKYHLEGSVFITSTACASGNSALTLAYNMIKYGERKAVIAGGYDPLGLTTFAGFSSLQNISPTRCKPFDKNRDGLSLGEGCALLVLEELEQAKRRGANIYCELSGCGNSSDAYHITKPDPEGKGAAAAMNAALQCAGLNPENINYINAHGTGTADNDIMEINAIKRVFGNYAYKIPVSSSKSFFGHILGGAGSVEAVVSILALCDNIIPPTLNYETPDPDLDLDFVPDGPREAELNYVLSNVFGFGGANSSIIFGKFDE